jgi:murein DD-endopeptidase MepM/ murein hydrolase activator NlpD
MNFVYWLFSSKHYEIKIVLATLAVLIMLPVFAVVVFASSGLAIASETLAVVNPITHLVEIFNPNGEKVDEIELSTVWPTKGYVSDEFGTFGEFRQHLKLGPHSGIDIANEYSLIGEPVTPFYEGEVIRVDNIDDSSCGRSVIIQHSYNLRSIYCHLELATALEHVNVRPGDIIGLMGSTGTSTGAHLHFMVTVNDIPVNPRTFMVGEPERSTVKSVLNLAF